MQSASSRIQTHVAVSISYNDNHYHYTMGTSHVPGYRPDWLAGIVVNHSQDLTNKFGSSFLIRTISETSRLPYLCNHHWAPPILFKSSALINSQTLKYLYYSLHCECQAVQHVISTFLKEWIASWSCFPLGQYSTDSTLLHSRQNLKPTKCWHEINNLKWWQFIHYILYLLNCKMKILSFFLSIIFVDKITHSVIQMLTELLLNLFTLELVIFLGLQEIQTVQIFLFWFCFYIHLVFILCFEEKSKFSFVRGFFYILHKLFGAYKFKCGSLIQKKNNSVWESVLLLLLLI